ARPHGLGPDAGQVGRAVGRAEGVGQGDDPGLLGVDLRPEAAVHRFVAHATLDRDQPSAPPESSSSHKAANHVSPLLLQAPEAGRHDGPGGLRLARTRAPDPPDPPQARPVRGPMGDPRRLPQHGRGRRGRRAPRVGGGDRPGRPWRGRPARLLRRARPRSPGEDDHPGPRRGPAGRRLSDPGGRRRGRGRLATRRRGAGPGLRSRRRPDRRPLLAARSRSGEIPRGARDAPASLRSRRRPRPVPRPGTSPPPGRLLDGIQGL
ncbi:hypothetical protein HK102_007295, partial [Quaeritorhiza haematococci]